jgi:prolyl-tRNA synthetase
MRMSHLFSQTLREAPSEAEIPSHQLLLRAGFIRQLAAGIFTYLPLARRSLTKIEDIMRQEMNAIGGQEISMPVVHPAEIWKETQRWYQIGSEMGRFKDKNDRDMVLAMTHEEVVADLVRKEVHSYRQLPMLIYHIQTKWRDDPRPRAGLIRVREFTMKDSYSLDSDWDGLDAQYRSHYQAYFNIFHRCDLAVIAVRSDVGMMGGKMAHEFMYQTPIGEDTLLVCDHCGYKANRQVARFKKYPLPEETLKSLQKVATPDAKTIEDLANFLEVPKSKTAKAVFMMAEIPEGQETVERFVFAVVRGDMEVNDTKLANAVKAKELNPATEEQIKAVGAVPGYASPIDLKGVLVVVDDVISESPNLVAGANQEGFHLMNTNLGRDYQADIVTDIAAAEEGFDCPECGHPLREFRGVEVGNIFKLGTRYSDAMGCYFLDRDGKSKPVVMGSYGIGSGRLLACIAEAHHDQHGLIWPVSIAPYQVHLVELGRKNDERTHHTAERLYQDLRQNQMEVLFDDREESPGVKFNDADLIGLPIRLTVSQRSLDGGGVEFKRRDQEAKRLISEDQLVTVLGEELNSMRDTIAKNVLEVPFEE